MRQWRWGAAPGWKDSFSALSWAQSLPTWWAWFSCRQPLHQLSTWLSHWCQSVVLSVCLQAIFLLWIPGLGLGVFAALYTAGNILVLIRWHLPSLADKTSMPIVLGVSVGENVCFRFFMSVLCFWWDHGGSWRLCAPSRELLPPFWC